MSYNQVLFVLRAVEKQKIDPLKMRVRIKSNQPTPLKSEPVQTMRFENTDPINSSISFEVSRSNELGPPITFNNTLDEQLALIIHIQ